MRKILLVTLFLLVSIPILLAESNAVTYPLDSSLYEDMDSLYAINGLARPSTNRPWSNSEARLILSKISRADLDEVSSKLYDRIVEVLENDTRWGFGDFGVTVGLDVSPEVYVHSNEDSFITETDWERGFDSRKSLLRLYFEFTLNDNFYTASDIHYKYRRADFLDEFTKYSTEPDGRLSEDGYVGSYKIDNMHYVSRSNHFSQGATTNVFVDTRHFSFVWPRRAVFSFGGDTWNFSVNRDVLNLGNARFSNLLVDGHTFSDYSKLSFFGKDFKYDLVFVFLNSTVEKGESSPNSEARIYMIHTLQFRVCDIVSFTVSENVMYKYATLDFSFMNPAFIYHNINNRSMFNAFAYADVNVALPLGIEFYAQFALDQARAPNEDESQSSSYGVVVGLGYTTGFGGGVLKAYCEYAKTSPLLYRRDQVDFIRVSRYPAVGSKDVYNITFFDYIGFEYGGDCRLIEVGASFDSLGIWKMSVFGRFAEKGAVDIFHSHNKGGKNEGYADLLGDTPYGSVSKRFAVIGLKASMTLQNLLCWPSVSLDTELDWIGRCRYTKASGEVSENESDLQFTIGLTIGL